MHNQQRLTMLTKSGAILTCTEYEFEIYFGGACPGYARGHGPSLLEMNLSYTNVYPSNPSTLGGEIFEIHGTGFTDSLEAISVKDTNGNVCEVLSGSADLITCQMPANARAVYSKYSTSIMQIFEFSAFLFFFAPAYIIIL